MDTRPTPEDAEAIEAALAAGNKIEAIKLYREATGQGLADSKAAVEALIARLREDDPETYEKVSTSGGCTSVLLLGASGLAGAVIGVVKWIA